MATGKSTIAVLHNEENTAEDTLSTLLSIGGQWKQSREGTLARYEGVKAAKEYALNESNLLLNVGRYLSYAVVFVSAVHVWGSIARIAPSDVPVLHLWPEVYHSAALLFTILIDITLVFNLKTRTALAYTGAKGNHAIWFFYIITALLNAAFVTSNSSDATQWLRTTLIATFGNLFIVLLPVTIPIALWSIEDSIKQLDAGKIKLGVEIKTLEGMIKSNLQETGKVQDNRTLVINQVLENDTYPDKVLPALTCAKCDALLPTTGDIKRDRGVWLSTHRFGCKTCKEGVSAPVSK